MFNYNYTLNMYLSTINYLDNLIFTLINWSSYLPTCGLPVYNKLSKVSWHKKFTVFEYTHLLDTLILLSSVYNTNYFFICFLQLVLYSEGVNIIIIKICIYLNQVDFCSKVICLIRQLTIIRFPVGLVKILFVIICLILW